MADNIQMAMERRRRQKYGDVGVKEKPKQAHGPDSGFLEWLAGDISQGGDPRDLSPTEVVHKAYSRRRELQGGRKPEEQETRPVGGSRFEVATTGREGPMRVTQTEEVGAGQLLDAYQDLADRRGQLEAMPQEELYAATGGAAGLRPQMQVEFPGGGPTLPSDATAVAGAAPPASAGAGPSALPLPPAQTMLSEGAWQRPMSGEESAAIEAARNRRRAAALLGL